MVRVGRRRWLWGDSEYQNVVVMRHWVSEGSYGIGSRLLPNDGEIDGTPHIHLKDSHSYLYGSHSVVLLLNKLHVFSQY